MVEDLKLLRRVAGAKVGAAPEARCWGAIAPQLKTRLLPAQPETLRSWGFCQRRKRGPISYEDFMSVIANGLGKTQSLIAPRSLPHRIMVRVRHG